MSELNPRTANPFAEVALSHDQRVLLTNIRDQLIGEGENISDHWLELQFNDRRIVEGLLRTEQRTGIPLTEIVRHSNRFSYLDRSSFMEGHIDIPQSLDNIHSDGRLRRHEEGRAISLDRIRQQGVDPSKVLYYRVTQPSYLPKPEYYWTSDAMEAKGGLGHELGSEQAVSAIILVSSLEKIASNGGLIEDVNDDQGVAVRQVGFEPFDQAEALFTFSRDPTK